jgi:guanylate kinase
MRKGILFILSGPSGAGKGTVLGQVIGRLDNIAKSVSATTRAPRPGEIDGIHYHFKSREEFGRMVRSGEFLEHIRKFGNNYGTPKAAVEKLMSEGTDVILEIETRGAGKAKKSFPKAVLIFVTPSDPTELQRRLDRRGSETPEAKKLRYRLAEAEYRNVCRYNYIALNDNLSECAETVVSIIRAERNKVSRNPELVEKFTEAKCNE